MTATLERAEALPQTHARRRRVALVVAFAAVVAFNAAILGTQAVRLRAQVGRERQALDESRSVEARARRSIASVQHATGTARANRATTLASDHERQTERAQANQAFVAIEHRLTTTNQMLTSTQAAQAQVAQYSALRDACINGVRTASAALQQHDPAVAVAALRAAAAACSAALAAATGARFPYDFPDPSVIRVGSHYYAYSTNSGVGNIQVLDSTDLVHWSIDGDGLAALPGWASPGATWAPAVVQLGSSFVAYYTTRDIGSGLQCISVATATSPRGPFVDSSIAPLVCQQGGSIDPSPFVDATGALSLLWKSEAVPLAPTIIWSQPLSADGLHLTGVAAQLLTPARSWEHGVVEGPSMIRIHGQYFLFYSGGLWTTAGYAEGVADCAGPAGPCSRILSGPVLASEGRLGGPGGGAAFTTPQGDVWLAFHAYTQPDVGYPNSRTLHLATIRITDGVPIVTPQ